MTKKLRDLEDLRAASENRYSAAEEATEEALYHLSVIQTVIVEQLVAQNEWLKRIAFALEALASDKQP